MTLKVEDIFEILEDIDTNKKISLLKEDSETSLVSGSKLVSGKTQTITLPKITISEDWGKIGSPDRKVLEFIVERATRGSTGRGALRKLANLNNYLDVVTKKLSGQFSISKLMASMIVIETMMKMFNSFSVGPSGFLNEAFMSVFYGATGEQVQVSNAHGIEDIVVKNSREYISLKTLERTRTDLEGSLKLLQKSLDDDTYGNKIFYHIFIKESKSGKIQNVRMYEIQIYRSSIPVFYEDSIDSSKAFMGLVYVTKRPPPPPTKAAPNSKKTTPKIVVAEGEIKEDFEDKTDTSITTQIETTNPAPKKKSKKNTAQQSSVTPVKAGPDPNEIDYSQCTLKSVFLRKQGVIKDAADFRIPESVWLRFLAHGSPKEGLFLDLSEEKYKQVLEKATKILDYQLSAIFKNLDDFSKNITQFFTDDDTSAGLRAYKHAQELEKRTGQLVKADEPEQQG